GPGGPSAAGRVPGLADPARRHAVTVPVPPHLLAIRHRGPRGPRRAARDVVERTAHRSLQPLGPPRVRPRPPPLAPPPPVPT
ncbi:MAG: Membrane protein insertion efficiency factor YidD, partial [uncultured Acidimicrobiales bacterium]